MIHDSSRCKFSLIYGVKVLNVFLSANVFSVANASRHEAQTLEVIKFLSHKPHRFGHNKIRIETEISWKCININGQALAYPWRFLLFTFLPERFTRLFFNLIFNVRWSSLFWQKLWTSNHSPMYNQRPRFTNKLWLVIHHQRHFTHDPGHSGTILAFVSISFFFFKSLRVILNRFN